MIAQRPIKTEGNLKAAPKGYRLSALDFTKGALVLFMVLYHWSNYIFGPQHEFYKYLRFLTPSFIFISGFLVSNMYLPRYRNGEVHIPKRMVARGLKLLALFLVLNVAISLLVSQSYNGKISFQPFTLPSLVAVYVTGNTLIAGYGKAAAFYILLPISYLLLLSAALLALSSYYKYIFHVVSAVCVVCSIVLTANGIESANLELVSIGLLGVMAGYISIDKINILLGHWGWLVLAYLCYTLAITFMPVGYVLQVVSVVLSLILLYLIGVTERKGDGARGPIVLLGRYSLFGYLIQIAILQALYRISRHIGFGVGTASMVLLAAIVLTVLCVVALDRARTRASAVDSLYRAVFS